MIISYVLTIGNVLNGSTAKGQADGFNLDILPKLSGIKDNSNKNLVQFICAKIMEKDESFDGLKKQFVCLIEAGKTTLNEINKNLVKLKKDVKDQGDNIKNIENLTDNFYEKAKNNYEKNKADVEMIEKKLEENLKYFQSTALFFGYSVTDTKYKNPDEFFSLINIFLDDVDKFIPKTEPKKNFKAKHDIGQKVVLNMDASLKKLKSKKNFDT